MNNFRFHAYTDIQFGKGQVINKSHPNARYNTSSIRVTFYAYNIIPVSNP